MLNNARNRARKTGVPFALTLADIPAATHCPALGVELDYSYAGRSGFRAYAPSLDRFIPDLGYVRGNVTVISCLANAVKSSATSEQVMAVAKWMKKNDDNNQK